MQFKQPDPNYIPTQPYSTSNQYCFNQNDAQTIPLSQMEMNQIGQPRTNYEHTSIRSNYSHHTIPYTSSVLYSQRWGVKWNIIFLYYLISYQCLFSKPFIQPWRRNCLWSASNKKLSVICYCIKDTLSTVKTVLNHCG